MVGTGLRKLARKHGMKLAHGVVYGDLRGYAVTLSEGAGYKRLDLTAKFEDSSKVEELLQLLNQQDLLKGYRIQHFEMGKNSFSVLFFDNPGTMAKLEQFVDWFFPLLSQFGIWGSGYCVQCGQPLGSGGCWKLVNGRAVHVHDRCVSKLVGEAVAKVVQAELEDTGTYGAGLLGALGGAFLGAIPWAVVLYLGYVASVLGLMIGLLSKRGYELLHGRKGPGKVVCVIGASILGVILGTLLCDVMTLAIMISMGELPGSTYGDIPALMSRLSENWEYLQATYQNVGMGLIFALLGNIGTFRELKAEQQGRRVKVKNLK